MKMLSRKKLIEHYITIISEKIKEKYTYTRGRKNKYSIEFYVKHILYVFFTGISWCELQIEDCHFSTIYKKFKKWNNDNIFKEIHVKYLKEYTKIYNNEQNKENVLF